MVQRLTIAIPWLLALVVGMILAVGSVPVMLSAADWYRDWRDENNPPATLEWNTVERLDAGVLRVTLKVTRHDDCQIVRVLGYSGRSLFAMEPADSMEREDGRRPQSYPVGITVISKPWIVEGAFGSKIAVSVYYDCGNRVVKAPLLIGDAPP